MKNGYVYIVKTESGKVKIGVSSKPKNRIASLQTATYERLIDTHVSPKCFNYLKIEENLHDFFKSNRLNGEWFDIPFETAVDKLNERKFVIDESEDKEEIINITIRIPSVMNEKIYKLSQQHGISMNSMFLKIFDEFIKQRKAVS